VPAPARFRSAAQGPQTGARSVDEHPVVCRRALGADLAPVPDPHLDLSIPPRRDSRPQRTPNQVGPVLAHLVGDQVAPGSTARAASRPALPPGPGAQVEPALRAVAGFDRHRGQGQRRPVGTPRPGRPLDRRGPRDRARVTTGPGRSRGRPPSGGGPGATRSATSANPGRATRDTGLPALSAASSAASSPSTRLPVDRPCPRRAHASALTIHAGGSARPRAESSCRRTRANGIQPLARGCARSLAAARR
jgi:hypothetical protein